MAGCFEEDVEKLYEQITHNIEGYRMLKANRNKEELDIQLPKEVRIAFWQIVDRVCLSLIEDKENFYGYFLFQTLREIRFDISSPTGIHFKGGKYVIYFNPLIFLGLNMKQMATSIKHEILHVLSMHLKRAEDLKGKYSSLAINMAMDVVVNKYLDHLPPYATTLNWVNLHYELDLNPYESFEYYLREIQIALDLLEEDEDGDEDDHLEGDEAFIKDQYDIKETHNLWEETEEIDEKTLNALTKKQILNAQKQEIPTYLESLIKALDNGQGDLPWQLYLKQLVGRLEGQKRKSITRRNRRQPERLDLRGNLRAHQVEIVVAIDISGSISTQEFKQAMKEVLQLVKQYKHKVTVIECDQEIKRIYEVKSIKDLQERFSTQGGTLFSPVIEHLNRKPVDLLVYFTDGKGEEVLKVKPRNYKVMWVLSGRSEELSLKEPHGVIKRLKKLEIKEEQPDMKDVRSDGYSMNNQEPI